MFFLVWVTGYLVLVILGQSFNMILNIIIAKVAIDRNLMQILKLDLNKMTNR